ncbi:MAG: hypothetical protein RIF41_16055, partial [Polyangiaceae bacterium]
RSPHSDGGYYLDIAAHVRDGHGLVSNVCLMHQGCPELPHPTTIYPLWPLLLGHVSRGFPLFETGKWLPAGLYVVTLVLGYLWGRALFPKPLFPKAFPAFDAGHLVALMLGTSAGFFRYTSLPYTEGLTFAIVTLALWRSTTLLPRPTLWGGLELGTWLALAFLARAQMAILAVAAFVVMGGAALVLADERRRYGAMVVGSMVALAVWMGLRYRHLAGFVPDLTIDEVVFWYRIRFSEAVSAVPFLHETHGALDYVLDRAEGVLVAYGSEGGHGYGKQVYTFHFAALAALPLAVLSIRRGVRERGVTALLRGWLGPERIAHSFALLFGLGAFLSLHGMHLHPSAGPEWLFGGRWAIPTLFLFFLSLVALVRAGGGWRTVGVFLLCAGVFVGLSHVRRDANKIAARKPATVAEPPLVTWLNRMARRRGPFTAVFKSPQAIAYLTPEVRYHWHHEQTSLEDVEAMVTELGADYVILQTGHPHAFITPRAPFNAAFKRVAVLPGYRVYAPNRPLLDRR